MLSDFIQNSFKSGQAILTALKHRDTHTETHCTRVAKLAWCVGIQMDIAPSDLGCLVSAAILHDVGKIGIPDNILLHDGTLNDSERLIMHTHAQIGQSIVEKIDIPKAQEVSLLVRWHHEQVDGSGYPDGLVGDEIPLSARIISAVDAFDAMTSTRVYRNALTNREALAEIQRDEGSKFDKNVVTAMQNVLSYEDPFNTIVKKRGTACSR